MDDRRLKTAAPVSSVRNSKHRNSIFQAPEGPAFQPAPRRRIRIKSDFEDDEGPSYKVNNSFKQRLHTSNQRHKQAEIAQTRPIVVNRDMIDQLEA